MRAMTLQLKPHRWMCLATSFAMALGIPVSRFCEIAGHDGSDIVFPDLPDPLCRRGFHIMEAIFVARRLAFAVTPVQLFPMISATPMAGVKPAMDVIVPYNQPTTGDSAENNWRYFQDLISMSTGVIECTTRQNRQHAVAFQFDHIFDPDGRTFDYSREDCEARGLFTTCLWLISPL